VKSKQKQLAVQSTTSSVYRHSLGDVIVAVTSSVRYILDVGLVYFGLKFNRIIPEQLPIYSESFSMISETVFSQSH